VTTRSPLVDTDQRGLPQGAVQDGEHQHRQPPEARISGSRRESASSRRESRRVVLRTLKWNALAERAQP
jgi:hypothetical protein